MTSSPLLFFFQLNGMSVMILDSPDTSVPQPHESVLFSPSITVRPKMPEMVVLSFLPGP
jgi:hypothetical protein